MRIWIQYDIRIKSRIFFEEKSKRIEARHNFFICVLSLFVTVCLKEEVAESLMEDLVKTDLARLLQVLDHHGTHARIRQYDLLASSAQLRFRIKFYAIQKIKSLCKRLTTTGYRFLQDKIRNHNKYTVTLCGVR
jgi:hypothetical protein